MSAVDEAGVAGSRVRRVAGGVAVGYRVVVAGFIVLASVCEFGRGPGLAVEGAVLALWDAVLRSC